MTDSAGMLITQQRSRSVPFGGQRTNLPTTNLPSPNVPITNTTDFTYTGQRALAEAMGGLMDYRARFYSPSLGRFLQPDNLIPDAQNPQAFNRYSYVTNNPVNFNDPTGHMPCEETTSGCTPIPPTNPTPTSPSPGNGGDGDDGEGDGGGSQGNNCTYHVGCSNTDLIDSAIGAYGTGWQNFGQAWSIWTNPNASYGQKFGAGAYMSFWGGAHLAGAIGGIILAWESIVPGSMSCIGNPECQQRVFWSGGKVAQEAAEKWANDHNGATLGMTETGKRLDIITQGMDWYSEARPLFAEASKIFAEGASGRVRVFVYEPAYSTESIWHTVESIALGQNPNVNEIFIYYVKP